MQAFSSSLFAVIRARRSHGMGYLDKPVEREKLEQILEAAHWAPSHGRTEPWRFVVFTGETRKKLGEAFAESYALTVSGADFRPERYTAQLERVWRAPVWIGLGLEPSGRFPEWEEVAAVACAVQNAWLAATALGLAGFWTSGRPAVHAHTAEVCGLVPPARLLGFLYLGYPTEPLPQGQRGDWQRKVVWNP